MKKSISEFRRFKLCVALIAMLAPLAGCHEQPSAPPLIQGLAEYHDQNEGFRFAPPEGWLQQKRGEYPPGSYEKELVLVQYRSLGEGKAGVFRVSMVDLPETESVANYLLSRPPGPEGWKVVSRVEPAQVAARPGEKISYTGVWEGGKTPEEVTKEVVAVRQGKRVYCFAGIFPSGDKHTQKLTRIALASVVWDERK